jgi:homospermidine synthase
MGGARKSERFTGRLVLLGLGSVGQGMLPLLVERFGIAPSRMASLALVRFCWKKGVLYMDACNEPWPGRYDNPGLPATQRSNHALREEMLAFRMDKQQGPTACITQDANPGLVSSFVKAALLEMARDLHAAPHATPRCQEDWAELARKLDVKVIHVAERDTQVGKARKQRGEFTDAALMLERPGNWTPLKDRSPLFPEPKDPEDPWQFLNFRVA